MYDNKRSRPDTGAILAATPAPVLQSRAEILLCLLMSLELSLHHLGTPLKTPKGGKHLSP